jgi:5'-nucleotidase
MQYDNHWRTLGLLSLLLLLLACRNQQQTTQTNAPLVANEQAIPAKEPPATKPVVPAVSSQPTIRLFYFASWNSSLLPVLEEGEQVGGLEYLAAIMEKRRAPRTLVLSCGDFLAGDINDRTPALEALNLLGLTATSLGKLELNYGPKALLKEMKKARFAMLSANVYQGDTRLLQPYLIHQTDGVKLGIIGITTEEAAVQAQPAAIEGLLFKDPIQEAKKCAEELKNKVDIIILLSNLRHNEDLKLAEEIPFAHLIIGRHDVETAHRVTQAGTVVVARVRKKRGGELGEIELTQRQGKWAASIPQFYQIGPATDDCRGLKDTKSLELIHKWQTEEKEMAEVVCVSDVLLDGDYQTVRQQETSFGNLLADILLASSTESDIAALNSGCIRASIPAGSINKGRLAAALPYKNKVVEVTVSGEALQEMLENAVSQYQKVSGAFLQIAGFSFTFNPELPVFARVLEVKVHGEPLQPRKNYRLITLDYLASGGDDYVMLKGKEQKTVSPDPFPKMVEQYLKKKGKLNISVEGRIVCKNTPK